MVFRSRDATQSVVELRLVYVDAQVNLRAYAHWDDGQGAALRPAGETDVTVGQWHQAAFVVKPDTDDDPGEGNGRFRWWMDGALVDQQQNLDMPTGLDFDDVAVGLVSVTGCSADVTIDNFGIGGLNPTEAHPLIVRSAVDTKASVRTTIQVSGIDKGTMPARAYRAQLGLRRPPLSKAQVERINGQRLHWAIAGGAGAAFCSWLASKQEEGPSREPAATPGGPQMAVALAAVASVLLCIPVLVLLAPEPK